MTKLTSKLVAAKVKGEAGSFADGNGLYLVVPKRGRAYWSLRYTAHSNYIRLNGGVVLGSIVLVNAGRDKNFTPIKKHLKILEERFHDQIRQQFGIHIPALTANEANYLVGFRTFDEIRNRCVKAEKETHLRLLSKGIK